MSRREWSIFAALVLLAAVIVSRGSHAMTDEAPHYLAVSHSIAHDFDLDLRNQYGPESGYLFRESTGAEFAWIGRGGALYPSNGLAFSAALVPAFVAAETLATSIPQPMLESVRWNRERSARDLISFALSLLYAWVAILTVRVAMTVCGRETGIVLPVFIAFASPPMIFMAFIAFTEVPAAFLCVWFLSEQTRPARRPWLTVLPLALLPWLHVRYVVIATAGLAWVARDRLRAQAGRRIFAPVLVLPLASIALLAGSRWWMFGTLVPQAPRGGVWGLVVFWVDWVPALLFDLDVGLLWVAPFWALALVGVPRIRAVRPDYVRFAWAAFLGTWLLAGLLSSSSGFAPPGRHLVPILPALAPLWSEGFSILSSTRWRWPAYATVAWAVGISAVLVGRPARMWAGPGEGIARIPFASMGQVAGTFSAQGRLARMGLDLDEASFVRSVRDGNRQAIELFLEAGFSPEPGLLAAVQAGRADDLELLLAKHERPGPQAARALVWARHENNERLIGILTSAGVDVDGKNREGETALIAAVRQDRPDELAILIHNGADVNAATATGQTALTAAIAKGDGPAVRQLIAAGANVNSRDADEWTPLMAATRRDDLDIVRVLIGAGADPSAKSRLGWTALMWAAYDGQLEIVSELLSARADVHAASKAGRTALIRAAEEGHLEIVRALIEAGADPEAQIDGVDARAWADRNGHTAVANLLERAIRSR